MERQHRLRVWLHVGRPRAPPLAQEARSPVKVAAAARKGGKDSEKGKQCRVAGRKGKEDGNVRERGKEGLGEGENIRMKEK